MSHGFQVEVFQTSIWDDTLYKAWSSIVNYLIPNKHTLQPHLQEFCTTLNASEVILFERSTFLMIDHYSICPNSDSNRFETLSNIIKQFKVSCNVYGYNIDGLVVKHKMFKVIMERFTKSTAIMIVVNDPEVNEETVRLNVEANREYFEKVIMG